MANSRSEVHLEFQGGVVPTLGWIAASILGGLCFGAPLAWVNAAIARWACRNTAFDDGTTAEFRGTGGEAVVWHVVLFVVAAGQQLALARTDPSDTASQAAIFVLTTALSLGAVLMLLKWFVYNLRLQPGPQLTFTGSYAGLAVWYFALLVSLITIIGWAWVAVAMYRWMASNVKGEGVAIEFRASAIEFLWRALVTAVGSLLIVTIPFLTLWLTRWLVSNVVLLRGVETEWGGFIEEQQTPQKPSWPAVPPLHRHID